MTPLPEHPLEPTSDGTLLNAGVAGGALSAVASAAMYVHPGTASGIAMTAADILVLFGLVGFDRSSGGAGRRRAILFMGANVIAAVASLVLPRIGIGPIFDLFGGLSWLADAVAYGVLGGVLLRHRTGAHPGLGVAAGLASVLRAGSALMLAGLQPVADAIGLPDSVLLRMWQTFSVVAGTATCAFFIAARARRPPLLAQK